MPKSEDGEQNIPRSDNLIVKIIEQKKIRLLEMDVKRGTIEQLRASTMPI